MELLPSLFQQAFTGYFSGKSAHLSLFHSLGTVPEQWFRGEILWLLSRLPKIHIVATNSESKEWEGKPDLVLEHEGRRFLIELKVLPKDRNYRYGWQRFLAGSYNKRDFEMLQAGHRDGVIYVYWPDIADWKDCKDKLLEKYRVTCANQFEVSIESGAAIFSLWLKA